MALHERDALSKNPLDISSLQNTHSVTEGAENLLLGKSKHLALDNGIVVDVYAASAVVSVETPLSSLLVTDVEKVDASPDSIEFQAQREGHRATLTLFLNGDVIFQSMPFSPTPGKRAASETKDTNNDFSREQNNNFSNQQAQTELSSLTSLPPIKQAAHVEQKQRVYQAKFNLGSDPFSITTTEGQMHVVLAYIREANSKTIPSDKSKAVKIAVLPKEQAFILDAAHRNEENSKGFLFRKGDFVKGTLVRRDFVQLTGKPGSIREVPIRGYAFTEPPSMLSPKQKPGR